MIGAGERAGSGIPKIISGWQWANWRTPKLYEKSEPSEQTLLELSTTSLIPPHVSELLELLFGDELQLLDDFERMILVTASIEGWINHQRACQLTSRHSRDVTLTLPKLVSRGFLVANGEKRGKSYSLPGMEPANPEEVFSNKVTLSDHLTHTHTSSTHKEEVLTHYEKNLTHKELDRDIYGRFLSDHFDKPFIDRLEALTPQFREKMLIIGEPARIKRRLAASDMRLIIKELCTEQYIAISVLSELVARTSQNIRQSHLKKMVENNELKLAFPHKANTPKQGYTSS